MWGGRPLLALASFLGHTLKSIVVWGAVTLQAVRLKGSTLVMSSYLVPGCYRSAAEWEVVEG